MGVQVSSGAPFKLQIVGKKGKQKVVCSFNLWYVTLVQLAEQRTLNHMFRNEFKLQIRFLSSVGRATDS